MATSLEMSQHYGHDDIETVFGQVWNKCSKRKRIIEHTIGKEAMFKAIRHEIYKRRLENSDPMAKKMK
jgi:N-acyl-L-homoserine lactone synthetase